MVHLFFLRLIVPWTRLFNQPVTQCDKGDADDYTCCDVDYKIEYVPTLEHLKALGGKGGKCGEATAEANCEQQRP